MSLKAGFSIGLSDDLPKRKAPPSKGIEHYQGSKAIKNEAGEPTGDNKSIEKEVKDV